jgi:Mrp family chromosome partitioning ATPase
MKRKVRPSPIDEALTRHFENLNDLKVPGDGTVETIDKMFGGRPYWRDFVRSDSFVKTVSTGILYRETIVDELTEKIEQAFSLDVMSGVMVKGPQGVGKSHSLVNLALTLQASGNYLVTFIPDCDQWTDSGFLLQMICASFGTQLESVNAPTLHPAQADYSRRQP